jgi:hypothetical protein
VTDKTVKPERKETIRQKQVHLQVGRYLLEQFSVPAFRSHVNVGLVDRERVQFYHANHSVILVSSAINFSARDTDGTEKFIAIMIAFSRLSLSDNGILHDIRGGTLFSGNEELPSSNLVGRVGEIQYGRKLVLNNGSKTLALKYGNLISHEPSLVGRATAVLHAESEELSNLVVKVSWPGSERVAENEFLQRARDVANSRAEYKWALNHLPKIFFSQEVVFGPDSTPGKIASLLENAEFINGWYDYERRTLRIIVQERLCPLKSLTDPREVAQVLLDIACSAYFRLFSGLLDMHLPRFSSPLVVRGGRNSASRPESE